jgi:hypothetical protein
MEEKRTDKEMRKPRSFQEWQDIRRKNPHAYYLPRNQAKVLQDRQQLGQSFYDRKKEASDDVFE